MKSGEIVICVQCGNGFYVPPSASKTAKYCSIQCKAAATRKPRKEYPVCGKKLPHTIGCKKGKYCSSRCAGIAIRKRIRVACSECGKEFERNPAALREKNFCSKECFDGHQRKGRGRFACKICNCSFSVRGRKRSPVYCSMGCRNKDPDFIKQLAEQNKRQQRRTGLNKLELAGRAILEEMDVSFREQVLLFGRFTVDVILTNKKIVIEWDGDYWHGNPKKYPTRTPSQRKVRQKDRSSGAYLRKCGYVVLRFWETDVKNHPEIVRRRVRTAIERGVNTDERTRCFEV